MESRDTNSEKAGLHRVLKIKDYQFIMSANPSMGFLAMGLSW